MSKFQGLLTFASMVDAIDATSPDRHPLPASITTPSTDTEALQQALRDRLPPYAVILYNDDYHSMDYVVEALVKSVPDLIVEEAVGIMFEAHNSGSAVVIVCLLEQAELYRDRIRGYGLGVDIRRE